MDRDGAIDVLVRFARLVSDAAAFGEILPILADAIRENVRADGVCVVEISAKGGARVVVARGLPSGAHELELVLDPMPWARSWAAQSRRRVRAPSFMR